MGGGGGTNNYIISYIGYTGAGSHKYTTLILPDKGPPIAPSAQCIRVSLDTRRFRFALAMMSEDGDSVELVDVVEQRRNSDAAL